VTLAGLPVPQQAREARYRVGVVPQFDNLDPDFTVTENLVVYARYFGIGERAARRRAPQLLEYAGLEDRAGARIDALSGGMKRRLTLARALVNDPDILFLDEPTTGLDPQSRRQLWDIIRSLRERGRTIVLTTHYMDEAERLCDRVAVIDHGKVIALGSPVELIRSLGGDHVVEFALLGVEHAPDLAPFRALPSVRGARAEGPAIQLTVSEPHVTIPALLDHVRSSGASLSQLSTRQASLEDVFVSLTGRHLRDA
jgi:ABC-type multidrug transport system ATPase subunit